MLTHARVSSGGGRAGHALLLRGVPHSTVQTLGGNCKRDRARSRRVWRAVLVEPFAQRAVGLFLQTETAPR
jgi:hypothetical protein